MRTIAFNAIVATLALAGCIDTRYYNTARFIEHGVIADKAEQLDIFRDVILVPSRDILLLDPLTRHIGGDEAWNAGDDLSETSFFKVRTDAELAPDRIAQGPTTNPPPQPPFKVTKKKEGGINPGFIGEDSQGRKFLFKPDDPKWPEQGSGAEVIGALLMWATGYNVPATWIVTIEGTGDPHFDGQRATAAAFIPHVRGNFRFDWFRYRREVRALRIVSAWINDVDRISTNTLVVAENDRATYYQIDFNSALGSWQGRPKQSWLGWQLTGDPIPSLLRAISFRAIHAEPDPHLPIFSPAVGRFTADGFQPLAWTSQLHNNAFDHMTLADARWIIAQIRRIDRPQLEAIVAQAHYSRPEDAKYIVDVLMARREKILELDSEAPPHP